MRTSKFLFINVFLFLVFFSNAQTVKVVTHETLPQKGFYPVLNSSGDKLLFTVEGYGGLTLFDINTKQITEITKEAGTGYDPQFAPDNGKVYYRKTSFENNRRFNAIMSFDLKSQAQKELLPPQRFLNKVQPLNNGILAFSGKNLLRATTAKPTSTPVYATANDDLKILLYTNKIQFLNPLNMPESRYIWVSLSPDSKKILFTAAGKGTYICDLKGKILASLGYLNAPVWFNNQYVVGMEDKDDGHQVISSKIVMMSVANNTKTEISTTGKIAMYPTASGKANRIAYHCENGEIEIISVKVD